MITVPFPDFDDLFRVQTGRPFNHTKEPIGLLDVRAYAPPRVFEKPGVKGGLPLGLPQVVPGFIVFDLFRRLEGRVFRSSGIAS